MKVTVCFGNVRVVVPCGSGDLLVQDLIDKAIVRYKKAIGKPPDYWVIVHNFKSSSDGGILDPDDQLNDVADDREQIVAQFEEQDAPPVPHNGGDGTSASSAGTASPDMFSGPDLLNPDKPFGPVSRRHGGKNDVIITENDLNTGSTLIVRRGSEPALNSLGSIEQNEEDMTPPSNLKRWSAIASIDETKSSRDSDESNTEDDIPVPVRTGGIGQEQWSAFTRFARDSTRQSLASNSSTLQRWIETQEKQEEKYNNHQIHVSRKEPVGGSGKEDNREAEENKRNELQDRLQSPQQNEGTVISLKNSGGPLGIHVVPDLDDSGRDMGLVIQGIEAGGRIYRDGRLAVHDRIVEINGTSLVDVDFTKAQDVFKQALQTSEISLRVVKNNNDDSQSQTQQPKPTGFSKKKPGLTIAISPTKSEGDSGQSGAGERKVAQVTPTVSEEDKRPVTPGKRTPPAVPIRHPNTALSSPTKTKFVAPTNTRRIGKKIEIELTKGPDGLGFSVTTRDNPAGGNCPIYIKNILPKGAAVRDGNLKSGDRLLEVNNIPMTGKSQSEAVAILRNTKPGSMVSLVVSRQVLEPEAPAEMAEPSSTLPSIEGISHKTEGSLPDTTPPNLERLTYNIALNDCGSAGLGVSVKGKTANLESGSHDLGIFIKTVITGGAAAKDRRLKLNDQLLEVNNEVLTGLTNAEAMEKLRAAMQKDQPKSGFIHLVVGRRPTTAPVMPNTESREVRVSQSDDHRELSNDDNQTPSKPNSEANQEQFSGAAKALVTASPLQDRTTIGVNKARNPVLDRLTGINNANNIRNESYVRATHDSLNESTDSTGSEKTSTLPNNNGMTISSPNSHRAETVLIEGDNYQVQMRQGVIPKVRPASTLGFTRPGGPDAPLSLPLSRSNDDLDEGAPRPPTWLLDWDKEHAQSPDGDLSPTVDDPDGEGFQREGFGRRSMSEKRRGHLDPRISEFYQKLKQGKNVDQNYSDKTGPIGPMLGLKKSSSLESLQTAVQEVLEDGTPTWRPNAARSMVRGRGCNDSFRAAVDRSYETGAPAGETMETLEEEESSEGGSVAHGHSMCESAQSSFSGSDNLAVGLPEESKKGKKKLKKDSKDKDKDKEKDKDKGGLFKGLGHMFRFGRHRKQLDQSNDRSSPSDARNQDPARQRQEEVERHQARQAAQDEHDRIHEQYRRLQEKQHQIDAANRLREEHLRNMHPSAHNTSDHEANSSALAPLSRAERIQQLRSEHQRRHRERQGQYPLDAQEEAYEHQLQEYEKQRRLAESGYRDSYPVPPRRPSETGADPYERPQSRVGYAPPADPGRYSHYQNYNEIQAQLTTHDRYQAMYQHYMAHQMAAAAAVANSEQQRARAKTPEPARSAPLVESMDSRGGSGIGYPRSQSTVDARAWHPASSHQHAQHLKHVQQHMQQHVQVVRPRSQTPQLPYTHHHSGGKANVTMLPPQILVNNGPPHEHYHQHQHRSHQHHSTRDSAMHYTDPMASSAPTGSYPADHGYGSLHRRRDDRGQNGVVSGPAQV